MDKPKSHLRISRTESIAHNNAWFSSAFGSRTGRSGWSKRAARRMSCVDGESFICRGAHIDPALLIAAGAPSRGPIALNFKTCPRTIKRHGRICPPNPLLCKELQANTRSRDPRCGDIRSFAVVPKADWRVRAIKKHLEIDFTIRSNT